MIGPTDPEKRRLWKAARHGAAYGMSKEQLAEYCRRDAEYTRIIWTKEQRLKWYQRLWYRLRFGRSWRMKQWPLYTEAETPLSFGIALHKALEEHYTSRDTSTDSSDKSVADLEAAAYEDFDEGDR